MLLVLPHLTRRRFPFAAPAAIALAAAALSFVDGRLVPFTATVLLSVMAVAFQFGMLPDRRQRIVGLAIVLVATLIVSWNEPDAAAGDWVFLGLLFSVIWLAGLALGQKGQQAARAEERAARLEREREAEAREAVTEERARIARELHDVVGHAVSVMTVQASAVRRLLRPEQQKEREALEVVEQTGRQALAEMRRLVDVLRRPEEAPALAPQPSLKYLDRLVEQIREAGLPVDLEVKGRPPQDLPAGVDLTAYRLVQEGLTNALKHAGAGSASVTVSYSDAQVEVSVKDDGRGPGAGNGGGHGLVGLRERVSVYGGELEPGRAPTGATPCARHASHDGLRRRAAARRGRLHGAR